MTSADVKNLTGQYILNTYGRYPVAIARGEGARLYDFEGKEYIDFTSGIGVTCMGYGDPAWAEAIAKQAKTQADIAPHVSNSHVAFCKAKVFIALTNSLTLEILYLFIVGIPRQCSMQTKS